MSTVNKSVIFSEKVSICPKQLKGSNRAVTVKRTYFSRKVSRGSLLVCHLGYGDFAGLGNFNNFESSVDHQQPAHITMDEGATPQPLSGNGRRSGNSTYSLQQVNGNLHIKLFISILKYSSS